MTITTNTPKLLALSSAMVLALCIGACTDDGPSTDTTATETGDGDGDPAGDGDGDTAGDGDGDTAGDGDGDTAGDGDGDTAGDGDGDTDTDDDPFVFDDSPPGDYDQLDRAGMPAINTAVIASKDGYNADTPESDIAGTYVPEIVASLEFLHGALDDDLAGFMLTPCDATTTCVAQAGPLVLPDTLKLTLDSPSGFPNGRKLADPVIDVTLAVVLLDLETHAADTLVGILNPAANDAEFLPDFPYLAPPN